MDKQILQQMISRYKRKIETYQAMIAEWEEELTGSAPSTGQVHGATTDNGTGKKGEQKGGGDVLSLVRDWQFFNKSQPEAAIALLEMVGHPLTTQQILDGIEKGGVKVGGKNPKDKKQNFFTILHRCEQLGKAAGARGTWGLMTWPNITKKSGDSGEDEEAAKEPKKATA